jgi:prepilin-type N-terminal cleavage/methylation domain-containing protein
MTRRHPAAGFTLVELLVVVAIFGLMAVLLSGGFHTLATLVGGGARRLDRTAALALTDNFLERVVADARPLPDGDGVAFDGEAAAMRFVGAPPVHLAEGGFHAEQLAVEDGQGGRQLVFRAAPLGTAHGSRSVLLDGIAAARFAYFGRLAAAEPAGWHERWPGSAGLPALIRISVSFPDGSAAPDLVVAPRPAEAEFQ